MTTPVRLKLGLRRLNGDAADTSGKMPRSCSICFHKARIAIERAIDRGRANAPDSGATRLPRVVARRHRDTHLRKALARSIESERIESTPTS